MTLERLASAAARPAAWQPLGGQSSLLRPATTAGFTARLAVTHAARDARLGSTMSAGAMRAVHASRGRFTLTDRQADLRARAHKVGNDSSCAVALGFVMRR